MGNILISINVTPKGWSTALNSLVPVLNLHEPNIYVHMNLIGDMQIGSFYRDYDHLELSQTFVNPPSYDKITNRQGRIGNLMNYRFDAPFDVIYLMDDDMEITDYTLFVESLHRMQAIILENNLAFLKTTTHPDVNKSEYQSNIGWPWMANGFMIRWFEFHCPSNLMDKWFFLDDFIVMRAAADYHGFRYAQYNHPIGLIHHTVTDADKKGIIVDNEVRHYLVDGEYGPKEFNQEFIRIYSEYYNSCNQFNHV